MRWLAALIAVALMGCGGPTPQAKRAPKAPSLAADIEAAAGVERPGDAVVTFAVFQAKAPKDAEQQVRAGLRAPPTALTGFLAGTGAAPRLTVTTQPVDEKLPLQLDALIEGAGPLAPRLKAAQQVTFLYSRGATGPRQSRLRWTIAAALVLADADSVLVDLGTQQVTDPAALGEATQSPTWLADQVIIEAALGTDGKVQFVSRGMAKLGLPDVEMGGVEKAKARLAFGAFTKVVNDIRQRGFVKPGDKTAEVTFGPCQRPAHAYTSECVRVAAKAE